MCVCYNLRNLGASIHLCYPHALQIEDDEATYNVPCLCAGETCSGRRALQGSRGDAGRRSLSTGNCLDTTATNYNEDATGNGKDCLYTLSGCTDSAAFNFDPASTEASRACFSPPHLSHRALAATPQPLTLSRHS